METMIPAWVYNKKKMEKREDLPPNSIGFTYLITFNEKDVSGKNYSYLGCKQFISIRGVYSGAWVKYMGSSLNVKDKMESGELTVKKREILEFAISKQQLAYMETREIVCRGLLEDPSSLNMWVKAKLFKAHIMEPKPMKITPKKVKNKKDGSKKSTK